MLDCISVENMRLSDAETIANLVPSLELMHRAADGVFRAVQWRGRVGILVGSGNNGGDGFALAGILKDHDIPCSVFALSQRLSANSAHYAAKAREAGVPILPLSPGCLDGFDMAVDCLLGTGFRGAVREDYRAAIAQINGSGCYVVSVDINSGMNGDTGEAELAVRSDLTVTIGYVKNGLMTANAGRYMKRLVCADIGIRLAKEENKICDAEEWETVKRNCDGTVYYKCPEWLDMNVIKVM